MKRTYAGAARNLDRAVTVAFYRTLESIGVPRKAARRGVERADSALQAIGTVYIIVAVIVVAALALGRALGGGA